MKAFSNLNNHISLRRHLLTQLEFNRFSTNTGEPADSKDDKVANKLQILSQEKGKLDSAKSLKSISKKYGKSKPRGSWDILTVLDNAVNGQMAKHDPNSLVNKAEGAVESLLFNYTTEERVDRQEGSKIVTIDTSRNALGSGLQLHEGGESDRRLTFDKDSLAL